MDEVKAMNKIEVDLFQEKTDFIIGAYQKELHHWKKIALESVSAKNELIDLVHLKACLICRVKNAKMVNIAEIIHSII